MSAPPLVGYGLSVDLPDTWEGRVYQRAAPTAAFTAANRAMTTTGSGAGAVTTAPGRSGWLGEKTRAIMHLGNFALPTERGDYGSGALERMGRSNVFVALLEFGAECLGSALFAPTGIPRPSAGEFDPNALQRRLPGQAGYQRFFTAEGRPFCLYVVLGNQADSVALTASARTAIAGISVGQR